MRRWTRCGRRARKLGGTYDDAWLKQDFPGFARDIDWHFFNCAPPDQWLPDRLDGDETYAFKNLHPTQPLLQGPSAWHGAAAVPGPQGTGGIQLRGSAAVADHGLVLPASRAPGAGVSRPGACWRRKMLPTSPAWCWAPTGSARCARPTDFRAVMAQRVDRKDGAMLRAARRRSWCPPNGCGPTPHWRCPTPSTSPLQQMLARARRRAEREHAATRDEDAKARAWIPTSSGPAAAAATSPCRHWRNCPRSSRRHRREAEAQKAKAEAEAAAERRPIRQSNSPPPACRRRKSRSGSTPRPRGRRPSAPPPCGRK